MATNPFEDEDASYYVLINDEGQHSLWPVFASVPACWEIIFGEDKRQACLDFIEKNWTDMRPKSLIRHMEAGTPRGRTVPREGQSSIHPWRRPNCISSARTSRMCAAVRAGADFSKSSVISWLKAGGGEDIAQFLLVGPAAGTGGAAGAGSCVGLVTGGAAGARAATCTGTSGGITGGATGAGAGARPRPFSRWTEYAFGPRSPSVTSNSTRSPGPNTYLSSPSTLA